MKNPNTTSKSMTLNEYSDHLPSRRRWAHAHNEKGARGLMWPGLQYQVLFFSMIILIIPNKLQKRWAHPQSEQAPQAMANSLKILRVFFLYGFPSPTQHLPTEPGLGDDAFIGSFFSFFSSSGKHPQPSNGYLPFNLPQQRTVSNVPRDRCRPREPSSNWDCDSL